MRIVGARAVCLLLVVAGCGNPGDDPGGNRLAYTTSAGDLTVLDLDTARHYAIDRDADPVGALSLSPDGRQLAFSQWTEQSERQVFVASVASGSVRQIGPGPGGHAAELQWGAGGYFLYYVSSAALDGLPYVYVVPSGQESHRLADNWIRYFARSPVDAVIAYDVCLERPKGADCPARLVVEDIESGEEIELATGPLVAPVAFLPSGAELITLEDRDGTKRLVLHAADNASIVRELADVDGVPQGLSYFPDTEGAISPDGREVLATAAGALIAVTTNDGSMRTLAEDAATAWELYAEFSAAGPAVWAVVENLTPETDTVEAAYSLYIEHDGTPVAVIADASNCAELPMLSPSGALAAWQCDGHVSIVSVPDATVIADLETWARVLGFDLHGAGIILAGEDLSGSFDALAYWTFDGASRALADGYFEFGTLAIVEWPYYDLSP